MLISTQLPIPLRVPLGMHILLYMQSVIFISIPFVQEP